MRHGSLIATGRGRTNSIAVDVRRVDSQLVLLDEGVEEDKRRVPVLLRPEVERSERELRSGPGAREVVPGAAE